jgi:voltage-gated potassium channel
MNTALKFKEVASPNSPSSQISARRFTWSLFDRSETETKLKTRLNYFLAVLIALNVIAVILESVQSLEEAWLYQFRAFEWFSVSVFSLEYILKLWSITEDARYRRPIAGRLKYALTFQALVDVISIAPSIIASTTIDLRIIRSFRLFRLFRILKLRTYQKSLHGLQLVLLGKKEELLIALGIMFFLVLTSSTLMFYLEGDVQPDKFSDIPSTLWWTIMTLTTVGYGDVYPITVAGKVIASVVATLGIAFFALPTAILAAGVIESANQKASCKKCPNCGTEVH